MAQAPLLQLSDISLSFGGDPLFEGLTLAIQTGDRLALVGRNGAGKSTLMKVMAGLTETDAGQRAAGPGVRIAYMEQDPAMERFATLGDFAAAELPGDETWRIAAAAEGLGFEPMRPVATASGGERRRAALARLMAGAPDLMLLDEPTNHLDIAAIGWLEREIAGAKAASIIISHDRAFLRSLTRAVLWIDRGEVRRQEIGFDGFEAWRDRMWEEENLSRHKLDRRIKAEARWAVEGISARRKRNMGRVRALAALRAERAAQFRRQGAAALAFEAGPVSGQRVIEAEELSKSFGDRAVVKGLSFAVQRGDRIAIVGPNGVGKTTLLRLLLRQEQPDAGRVRHGTNLAVASLDQGRAALDPDLSLWETLTGDPEIGLPGRSDQVMVRGQPRHAVGYLKDFLFSEAQARAPVRALSGGEKARLLLARLMARESNLLVLDEPTNDLDIETLDLLQEVLGDYDGTVLLVSHDRDFIDRVATTTLWLSGGGRVTTYAGGWSDALAQGASIVAPEPAPVSQTAQKTASATAGRSGAVRAAQGLSFTERHRLEALPEVISRIEAEIARLAALLAEPDVYARDPARFRKASEALADRQVRLAAAEEEWLALAGRAEG